MNIYFDIKIFNTDCIFIKQNNKIIYNINKLQLFGVPFTIKNYEQKISNNLEVYLLNTEDINFFNEIDTFFKQKIKNYKSLINGNLLILNNVNYKTFTDEINICINSLKIKDLIYYLNILII